MNILLVDDKADVVSGIIQGVHWNEIGNIRIFSAYSGEEAFRIIVDNHIGLVITDIEMPGMNGLELAEKIGEYDPSIKIIFLSSHDSFRYAQAAIRLNCSDYILQPVDYKVLEQSIITVINEVFLERSGLRGKDRELMELRTIKSWRQVLFEERCLPEEKALEILQDGGVFLRKGTQISAVLLVFQSRHEKLGILNDQRKTNNAYDTIKSYFQEKKALLIYSMGSGQWVLLFNEDYMENLQILISTECFEHQTRVAAYVSDPSDLEHLSEVISKLKKANQDNVAGYTGIFHLEETAFSKNDPDILRELSTDQWVELLLNGDGWKIRHEIEDVLNKKRRKKELNRTTLTLVLQILINTFYHLNITNVGEMMSAEKLTESFRSATDSEEALLQFTDDLLDTYQLTSQMALDGDGKRLVEKIKNYISFHIGNRLSREEIAERFYISKDYISHIFRQYEGVRFTQYVTEQKMEKAKELILHTNLSLKTIAISVGIEDYTYFSRIFRDYTGVAPNEYRAKIQN